MWPKEPGKFSDHYLSFSLTNIIRVIPQIYHGDSRHLYNDLSLAQTPAPPLETGLAYYEGPVSD
jgi:hypothetical protein